MSARELEAVLVDDDGAVERRAGRPRRRGPIQLGTVLDDDGTAAGEGEDRGDVDVAASRGSMPTVTAPRLCTATSATNHSGRFEASERDTVTRVDPETAQPGRHLPCRGRHLAPGVLAPAAELVAAHGHRAGVGAGVGGDEPDHGGAPGWRTRPVRVERDAAVGHRQDARPR